MRVPAYGRVRRQFTISQGGNNAASAEIFHAVASRGMGVVMEGLERSVLYDSYRVL